MTKLATLRTRLATSTVLVSGLLFVAAPAYAQASLPDTGNVTATTAGLTGGVPGSTNPTFNTSGAPGAQTLTVGLNDNRTLINWGGTGFNVAAGNSVKFADTRVTSGVSGRTDNIAVLNRDLSGSRSSILGSVTSDANVAVYFINGNGIYFGNSSVVNTGALLASTMNITDDNDFLTGNTSLRLAGPSSSSYGGPAILFGKDASITTTANSGTTGGRMGDLILVSSQITRIPPNGNGVFGNATLTANNGDVGIIVASDVTISNAPGSPLSMIVRRGSDGGPYGALVLAANVTGRNVTIADIASGLAGIYGDNMEFTGSITATGASVTDRGVVLTNGAAPGVVLASTPGTTYADPINAVSTLSFVGTLQSAKDFIVRGNNAAMGGQYTIAGAADIDITGGYSADGELARFAPNTSMTAGSISIKGLGLQLADVATTNGNFVYNGGSASIKNLTVAGDILATMTGGLSLTGAVKATGKFTLSTPGNLYISPFGGITVGGAIDISSAGLDVWHIESTSSDVTLRSTTIQAWELFAAGKVDAQARNIDVQAVRGGTGVSLIADVVAGDNNSGIISTDSVTATNANADLYLRAGRRVTGRSGVGNIGSLQAGRDATIDLNISTSATLTSVLAGRNATVNVTGSLTGTASVEATTGLASITSSTGNVMLQSLKGGTGASASGRSITLTNGSGGTGDFTLTGNGGNVTINAGGTLTGRNVIVSTDKAFINRSGAGAISATGHWVVYSANPTGDTFGGLDSGNTALWNSTLATRDPSSISGNRYVFALQPTLTFTTQSFSKVYGTDLTGSSSAPFSVAGYQPGVTGAFLADTATTAFSGAPQITSAGFATRASVAGGPYSLSIATGTLQSGSGYAFAFNSLGQLTVTAKELTGTISVDNKTYDRTTAATGSVTLSGVVAGDTVSAIGTSFAFADKNAGTHKAVNVTGTTLTGSDAGNYTLSIPATAFADILKAALTGTITVNNKTYDGTTAATGSLSISGVIAGDQVGTTGSTFAFADRNAGTGKTVTLTGTTLTGADAGNYTLTLPPSALADILKAALTGTVTINNKTYDGTTTGSGSIALNGVVAGDTVGTSGTSFTFADRNAGAGKTVTVSGTTLTGADAGNYTLTIPATALADILKRALTGAVTINNKTYDGTTAATGSVTLSGVVAGENVGTSGTNFAFADKNAGSHKAVNVTGTTLTGSDAGNYTLSIPATAFADILKAALTGTVTVNNKTYDGTTAGSGSVTLNGVIAGDSVGTASTVFTFADKNAGTGKTVTIGGTTLTGADAGNYTLTIPSSALANILKAALTATVTVNNKTYDRTTIGSGSVALNGVIAGDTVGTTGTSFTFADKNAGAGKTVTISGTTLTGADAQNYTLTIPASALADILKKALTGTITVNGKTYDGTTAGSGSVALTGVVAGDTVGTTGSVFTFADRNAGTGKTVTVSGTTLNGADAGNYTLSIPASALGDIARRVIAVAADNLSKTQGASDLTLTYTITSGSLVTGDNFSGALTRAAGEIPGPYAITQGTLSAGGNYTLNFTPGTLTINLNPVSQQPQTLRALTLPSQIQALTPSSSNVTLDQKELCGDDKNCVVK